jgi:predicted DNA-binding transcriptional regulator AlpA
MEGFLTAEQLAARLGVKRDSIYRMHTRGDLLAPDEKVGRTPLWSVASVDAWEKDRPGHGWRKGKKRETPASDSPEGG